MNFKNPYNNKTKKKNGVYYTPQDISEFMCQKTKLFDDNEGVWLDPCCGSGILAITLASIQEDPISFIESRLIVNEIDPLQLNITLNNFKEKFGVVPKHFNEDFLKYDFNCDYIIMNPPYFKYEDSDIYAYFLDKVCKISNGFISINPTSFTNGKKYTKTRKEILKFNSLTTYHFDNIPGHIFDDAIIKVSIIIAHNESHERKTTGQIRWKTANRSTMISNLDTNLDNGIFNEDIFYKTTPNTTYLIHNNNKLSDFITEESEYPIYITNTPRYFISASSKKLNRMNQIKIFMNDEYSYIKAMIMLNSSYLYWWWRTSDSSMSLTKKTLLSLPWMEFDYNPEILNKIIDSENNNKVYKKNAGELQENIKHPTSLIGELNDILNINELITLHR